MRTPSYLHREHLEPPRFEILTKELGDELTVAHHRHVEATRPHRHPLLDIDKRLLQERELALRTEIRKFAGDSSFHEIETYCLSVLAARTSREAMALPRPDILGGHPPRKLVSEEERSQRRKIVHWMYLRACDVISRSDDPTPFKRLRSLAWGNWSNFDIGIEYDAVCPSCDGIGAIHLHNLENPAALSFSCPHCNHRYSLLDSDRSYDDRRCSCSLCATQNRILLEKIRHVFAENRNSILDRYRQWAKKIAPHSVIWPTEEEMFRHYELNKNNIGKDLRAILNLEPKTITEFDACVSMYAESGGGKVQSIFKNAVKAKLIYESDSYVIPDMSSLEGLLHRGCFAGYEFHGRRVWGTGTINRDMTGGEKIFRALFEDDKAVDAILVRNAGIWIELALPESMSHGEPVRVALFRPDGEHQFSRGLLGGAVSPDYSTERRLNPFFTGELKRDATASFGPNIEQPNLFNSKTEENAAARLSAEFPEYWIVPNRLMRRIVDLDKLRTHFSEEEFSYIKSCELDFSVYDTNGNIVLVEEVQRGQHHNDPKWIWKDSLKRRVFELARIRFRESF